MSLKVSDHLLVPKHAIVSKEAQNSILEQIHVTSTEQLPVILRSDPSIKRLKPQLGDIVRIERKSPTAGLAVYYRVVR